MAERGYVFVHIPKTAGRSVLSAMGVTFRCEHKSLGDYAAELGADVCKQRFKFTVVRNPWDRAVSFYRFFYSPVRQPALTFEHWLQRRSKVVPLRAKVPLDQFSYCRVDGVVDMDAILKFENVEKEFQPVAARFGITGSLPHVGENTRVKRIPVETHESFRDYYASQWSVDFIAGLNSELIERMGYTF
jgi:hypothetical protein